MEQLVIVLYKGAFAHFTISKLKAGIFTAHLQKYQGHLVNGPPHNFTLQKEGIGVMTAPAKTCWTMLALLLHIFKIRKFKTDNLIFNKQRLYTH